MEEKNGTVHHVLGSWLDVEETDLWPGDTVEIRGETFAYGADGKLKQVERAAAVA